MSTSEKVARFLLYVGSDDYLHATVTMMRGDVGEREVIPDEEDYVIEEAGFVQVERYSIFLAGKDDMAYVSEYGYAGSRMDNMPAVNMGAIVREWRTTERIVIESDYDRLGIVCTVLKGDRYA